MTVTERINTLTTETTQTVLDAAYLAQKHNAQLVRGYFDVLEANEKASRELLGRLVKQSQEAQTLWLDYVRESVRTGQDLWVKTAGSQLKEAGEQFDKAAKQATNSIKKETVATK